MALGALLVSSLLVVLGLFRAEKRNVRRGLLYWWTLSTFGFQILAQILTSASVIPADDQLVGQLIYVPMLGLGVMLVVGAVLGGGAVSLGGLLCVAPVVVSLAFVLNGGSLTTPLQAMVSMLVVIILPVGGYDVNEIMDGLRASLMLTAGALFLMAASGLPGDVIGECRLDKCSLWGLQIGHDANANAFGVSIACLGVIVALGLTWRRAVAVLIGIAMLTDLSASRSALLPLAFGVAAILIERVARGRTLLILRTTVIVAGVASIATTALWDWAANAFTGRAALWAQALALVKLRPLTGWGVSYWVRQPPTSANEVNYATHNLLLELGVSFGAIGIVAIAASLAIAWMSVASANLQLWHATVVCWLGAGISEVVAAPGRLYLLPGLFLLPFLLVLPTSSTTSERRPNLRSPRLTTRVAASAGRSPHRER